MKKILYIFAICNVFFDINCSQSSGECCTPPLQGEEHRRVTPPRRIMNPTYDTTFKVLFGGETQESKDRTKHLLNSILDLGITSIDFLPTEKKEEYQKHIIYDVLCRCKCEKNGREYTIDVEIQRKKQTFYFDRAYYYGAQALVSSTESAQSYDDIPKTIVLSFLDHVLPDDKEPIFCGRMMKTPVSLKGVSSLENPKVLSDKLEFWCIQLPRVGDVIHNQKSLNDISADGMKWLKILSSKYISASNRDDDIPLYGTEEYETVYQTALDVLESYKNEQLHRQFKREQMDMDRAMKNYVSQVAEDIRNARTEAKAEGLAEGEIKGAVDADYDRFKKAVRKKEKKEGKKIIPYEFKLSGKVKRYSKTVVERALSEYQSEEEYQLFLDNLEAIKAQPDSDSE